jgi:hypothetical protein
MRGAADPAPSSRGRAAEPGIQSRRGRKVRHRLRFWIPGSPSAPRNDGVAAVQSRYHAGCVLWIWSKSRDAVSITICVRLMTSSLRRISETWAFTVESPT